MGQMREPPTCPTIGGACDAYSECEKRRLCRHSLLAPIDCLHFVGFKDERYWNAVKVFGLPDFVHRHWDHRARAEIMPHDVAVFATGGVDDEPTIYTWNDSEEDIIARATPQQR